MKSRLILTADLFTIFRSVRLGTTSDIMNVSSMKASELQSVICWKENLNVPQHLGELNNYTDIYSANSDFSRLDTVL